MDEDRQANAELLVRLGRWLDDKAFDDASTVFDADVVVTTPGGTAQGIEAASAQARRNHEAVTQHLFGNVLVDIDGDGGRIEAESFLTMVEANGLRMLGGRYRIETVRTDGGWRIRRLQAAPTWDSSAVAGR
jgi:hypothetical protein